MDMPLILQDASRLLSKLPVLSKSIACTPPAQSPKCAHKMTFLNILSALEIVRL